MEIGREGWGFPVAMRVKPIFRSTVVFDMALRLQYPPLASNWARIMRARLVRVMLFNSSTRHKSMCAEVGANGVSRCESVLQIGQQVG
jgi:hypothetical protein